MVDRDRDIVAFLDEIASTDQYLAKTNKEIDRFCNLLQRGYSTDRIKSKDYHGNVLDFILEIAKCRLLTSDKFSRASQLWLDRYSASYSTPEIVGAYRSRRLSGNSIVDIGCGAGMQSIMFARQSQVTGIEKDPVRSRLAKLNASVYGEDRIRFLNEDCFESNYALGPDDLIFSDPLRAAGIREKTMSTMIPDPIKVLEHFGWRNKKYVFDLPPTMPLTNIQLEGEREYISINGRINRLTVYSPQLQSSSMTAVLLPGEMIVRGEQDSIPYEKRKHEETYLSIPDESLIYAHLLNLTFDPDTFSLFSQDRRRIILSSEKLPKEKRIGEFFEVISETDQLSIRESLKELQPSRVYPRFELDSDEYYDYVRSISDPLWVGESLYLFKKESRYVLARKL